MTASWKDLGVSAPIIKNLESRGIMEPFPIQEATLRDSLAGRDVCGKAPTGSGKTLAFGIVLASAVGKCRPGHPQGWSSFRPENLLRRSRVRSPNWCRAHR
ncbi:MAG: DEAD/DEAH box helicase [Actinobacteria bacterium]|nr:DEAD/DEAH box helicase [Actinomycetota bacterium]